MPSDIKKGHPRPLFIFSPFSLLLSAHIRIIHVSAEVISISISNARSEKYETLTLRVSVDEKGAGLCVEEGRSGCRR